MGALLGPIILPVSLRSEHVSILESLNKRFREAIAHSKSLWYSIDKSKNYRKISEIRTGGSRFRSIVNFGTCRSLAHKSLPFLVAFYNKQEILRMNSTVPNPQGRVDETMHTLSLYDFHRFINLANLILEELSFQKLPKRIQNRYWQNKKNLPKLIISLRLNKVGNELCSKYNLATM